MIVATSSAMLAIAIQSTLSMTCTKLVTLEVRAIISLCATFVTSAMDDDRLVTPEKISSRERMVGPGGPGG